MPRPSQRAQAPVHNRLEVLRTDRGLSRQGLADAVGVHYQTIGYVERGEFKPSLVLALKIAALFEVPLEQVFSLAPFPAPDDQMKVNLTHDRPL